MGKTKFKISKKYIRGDKKGKHIMDEIVLDSPEAIHNYLWEMTDNYEKKKIDYVVEWYKEK